MVERVISRYFVSILPGGKLPEEIVCHLDVTDLHMHYDKRAVGAPAHI
jgi:hypothetical protein